MKKTLAGLGLAFFVVFAAYAAVTTMTGVSIVNSIINSTTIGATTPSTGAFTTASASGGFTGNLTGTVTGNASTATALAAAPTNCVAPYVSRGIAASGNASCGPQLQSATIAGCTTGNTTYSTCNTTITWPAAFSDVVYYVSCTGNGPSDPRAAINGISAKSTTGITVTTVTEGSVAISFSTIECTAIHN